MTITVELRGFAEAVARLNSFTNWKQGLPNRIGAMLKKQHERRITTEKAAPSGARWAQLKASTIDKKASQGHGNASDILIDTGSMSRSFSVTSGGDVVRLTNTARYAFRHQGGTKHMVARPLMGLSGRNVQEIQRLVDGFLRARLGV